MRVMTPRLTEPVVYSARARRPAKLGRLALFLVRKFVLVSTEPILPVIAPVPAGPIVRIYSF